MHLWASDVLGGVGGGATIDVCKPEGAAHRRQPSFDRRGCEPAILESAAVHLDVRPGCVEHSEATIGRRSSIRRYGSAVRLRVAEVARSVVHDVESLVSKPGDAVEHAFQHLGGMRFPALDFVHDTHRMSRSVGLGHVAGKLLVRDVRVVLERAQRFDDVDARDVLATSSDGEFGTRIVVPRDAAPGDAQLLARRPETYPFVSNPDPILRISDAPPIDPPTSTSSERGPTTVVSGSPDSENVDEPPVGWLWVGVVVGAAAVGAGRS